MATPDDDLHDRMARRATETGLLVAAAALPATFQHTLTSRSNLDQALVTGLTFTIGQGLVSTVQEGLQALSRPPSGTTGDDVHDWHRRVLGADALAVLAGLGLEHWLDERDGETLWRATARTSGWLLKITGTAGLAAGAVHAAAGTADGDDDTAARAGLVVLAGALTAARELDRRRHERLDEGRDLDVEEASVSVGRSLAMGAGVTVGAAGLAAVEGWISERVAGLLASVLPGGRETWRPVGHLASVGLLLGAARAAAQPVFRSLEGANTRFEAALDVAPWRPEVSGSPDSTIPYETMGRMGRRMAWTVRAPDEIERVVGEPAVAHPVRVYGGLELAPTVQERVDLVLDDLERAGGLERRWLMLVSPTGTGYANYAALGALEFLTRGDCASVAMQYSARPSPLSLDRVDEGREQFRALVDTLGERLAGRDQRPRVVVFGESLGAWTSQDAFLHQGTDGLRDADVDHALWIGTPFESKWKDQVLSGDRPDVDPSLLGVFNDIGEWDAQDPDRAANLRFVMLTHHDDGVARFGQSLLVQRPDWLGDPDTRPSGVRRSQRWIPITTFVQTLVDMKNAARVVPGVFAARGHDYRADLAPFLAAVLDLPATPDQQDAIRRALEAEEAVRTRWIADHGTIGNSMAVQLVERIRSQSPEAFTAAMDDLRAEVRGWGAAWEEGTEAG